MPEARLFLPQDALEQWLSEGAAHVEGDELEIDGVRCTLAAAVRVLREVAGGEDEHNLVGRVKSLEQLAALGGEHCAGSVLLGESAYEVVDGFVARVLVQEGETRTHGELVKLFGRR